MDFLRGGDPFKGRIRLPGDPPRLRSETKAQDKQEKRVPTLIENRLNPLIKPGDRKWQEKHAEFTDLLGDPDKSLHDILGAQFSEYDITLLLPEPTLRHMAELQRDNSERFQRLLSGRFKGQHPTLATKLTMQWFGLPVEPILMPDFTRRDDDDEDCPDGMEMQERRVIPPLHFLTAYNVRNWGRDTLRGSTAPFTLRSVAVPASQAVLSLRGGNVDGGNDNGNDTDDYDDDDGDVDYTSGEESESEHGSLPSESEEMSEPERRENGTTRKRTNKSSRRQDSQEAWLSLYGYQGRLNFCMADRDTFIDAVKRLIGAWGQTQVVFEILQYDSGEKTPTHRITDVIGTESSGSTAWNWVTAQLKSDSGPAAGRPEFFVKRMADLDPKSLEPDEDAKKIHERDLVRIVDRHKSRGAKRENVAYLMLPRPFQRRGFSASDFGANHYDAFLRTALRVLYTEPGQENMRQGEAIPVRHGVFTLAGKSQGESKDESQDIVHTPWPSYGAVDFPLATWDKLDPRQREQRVEWTLHAIWRGRNPTIVLRVPGLYPTDSEISTAMLHEVTAPAATKDDKLIIRNIRTYLATLLKRALGDEARRVKSVKLYKVEHFYDKSVESLGLEDVFTIFPVGSFITTDEIASTNTLLRSVLADGSRLILVQPQWAMETADEASQTVMRPAWIQDRMFQQPTAWDPLTTLAEFRSDVEHLIEKNASDSVVYNQRRTLIMITPESESLDFVPRPFIVAPETTEGEWKLIRRQLVTRKLCIDIAGVEKHFVRELGYTPWGPRYGEVARWNGLRLSIGAPSSRQGSKIHAQSLLATQSTAEMARRATPGPAPQLDAIPLTADATAPNAREYYWTNAPSLYKHWQPYSGNNGNPGKTPRPAMPLNGPPLEPMLRVGSSVPMVSKGMLTMTEIRELQHSLWDVRNVALERLATCPYRGCNFTYRFLEQTSMDAHLADKHPTNKQLAREKSAVQDHGNWANQCPFTGCRTVLSGFDDAQMRRHILRDHYDEEGANPMDTTGPTPVGCRFNRQFRIVQELKGKQEGARTGTRRGRPPRPEGIPKEPSASKVSRTSRTPKSQTKTKLIDASELSDVPIHNSGDEVPARRPASPNWDEKLRNEDSGMEEDWVRPGRDIYCSRCLRKAPSEEVADGDPDPREQIDAHSRADGSCRIRNKKGDVDSAGVGLPNRSGWVTKQDVDLHYGGITAAKKRIGREYPAYKQTLCLSSANKWSIDPNQTSRHKLGTVPWPPYKGNVDLSQLNDSDVGIGQNRRGEESVDNDDGGGPRRSSKRKSGEADALYKPAKDDKLADEEEEEEREKEGEKEKDLNGEKKNDNGPKTKKQKIDASPNQFVSAPASMKTPVPGPAVSTAIPAAATTARSLRSRRA